MRRSDALVLIAVWEFLTALGLFIGIVSIALFAFPDAMYAEEYFGLSVGTVALLILFGISVAAGIGLLRVREWGRVLAVIHSALSLIFIPIGTIIGALSLAYLVSSGAREQFQSSR